MWSIDKLFNTIFVALPYKLVSSKKALLTTSLTGIVAPSAYYVSKPVYITDAEVYGESLEEDRDVDWLIKTVRPLNRAFLENPDSYGIPEAIAKYLKNQRIPQSLFNKSSQNSLVGDISEFGLYRDEFSVFQDIEVPYRLSLFGNIIKQLTDSQIGEDILWSLAQESHYQQTIVDLDSIKLFFELSRSDSNVKEGNGNILSANSIHNFQLSFRVINPNYVSTQVFKSITLNPRTVTNITLSLESSEIRPIPKKVDIGGFKFLSWNLFPYKNRKWKVSVNRVVEEKENLELIYGSTKFSNDGVSNNKWWTPGSVFAINTPTYKEFKSVADPVVRFITEEQIKIDLENWYKDQTEYYLKLFVNDLRTFLYIIKEKIFKNSQGDDASIIDNLINEPSFRDMAYTGVKLDREIQKSIDELIKLTSVDEMVSFVEGLRSDLETMQDQFEVKITWKQEPKILGRENTFPIVSFDFDQKISWKKSFALHLKGKYDSNEKKVVDNDGKTGSGNYDFSRKLQQVDKILKPLKDKFPEKVLGVDLFSVFLPDLQKFTGIEKFEIDKDESIDVNYKSSGTLIVPSLLHKVNLRDNASMLAGWKALDVTVTYDLSNFHKFFYKIYESLDIYKDEAGSALTLVGIMFSKGRLTKDPFSFIVHAIQSFFDPKYLSGKSDTPVGKRPWPVFFSSLLSKKFEIESKQIGIPFKSPSDKVNKIAYSFSPNYSSFFPSVPVIMKATEDTMSKFLDSQGATDHGLLSNKEQVKTAIQQQYSKDNNRYYFPNGLDLDKTKLSFMPIEIKKALKSVLGLENTINNGGESGNWLTGILSWTTSRVTGIKVKDILGEAFLRDAYLVSVNLNIPEGKLVRTEHPIKTASYSEFSEQMFMIQPKLDKTKFKLGSISSWVL